MFARKLAMTWLTKEVANNCIRDRYIMNCSSW